jgi:hypothetical protein
LRRCTRPLFLFGQAGASERRLGIGLEEFAVLGGDQPVQEAVEPQASRAALEIEEMPPRQRLNAVELWLRGSTEAGAAASSPAPVGSSKGATAIAVVIGR